MISGTNYTLCRSVTNELKFGFDSVNANKNKKFGLIFFCNLIFCYIRMIFMIKSS